MSENHQKSSVPYNPYPANTTCLCFSNLGIRLWLASASDFAGGTIAIKEALATFDKLAAELKGEG